MKKPLLLLPLYLFIAISAFSQSDKAGSSNSKNDQVHINTSEKSPYSSRVFNACTEEWVKLSGSIIYNVKEMRSSKKYFILYNINLKDVEGIGEKSGTVYKGGGKISDKVLNTYENNHVVGSNTYKVIYKAANTSITTTQKAHYVMANDQLKVEYNEAYESCE